MSPPRVAYLLKKFPRLSETFVLNEILMQERGGLPVHVFSRRPPDPEPRHPQLADLKATVEYLSLQQSLEPWLAMFGPKPEQRRTLERFGELVRELSSYEHSRLPALFAEALFLLGRCRELGIEHVHVHFATDSAVTAMLVHDLGGPTYSLTAHAKDIYRTTVNARLLSRIVARSEFTVTVCDANVRHLSETLSKEAMSRVRRLYNGIDLVRFRPSTTPRDESHVLSVGRLVEKKGFPVLVDALAILRDRGVPFRATFVGEGEDRVRIEAAIAAAGLTSRIRLTGALDQDAVRAELGRATVMCLPCVIGDDGNRDALPTSLLESIASGLPCISTPVTGIPEILADGKVGVLVPENDPVATADAIQSLFEDRGERQRFATAGRAHAEHLFDAESSARTLREWFEHCLAEPQPR
jgi:glycosyltransferase involved in cell wall biosynthesis